MAAILRSPGVLSREVDLSQVVGQGASSSAGTVVLSNKGRVGVRNLATSVQQFLEQSGQLDPSKSFTAHSAVAALRGIRNLYWVRAVSNADFAGVVVNTGSGATLATQTSDMSDDITDVDDLDFSSFAEAGFAIFADNPGTWGNKIAVSLEVTDEDENLFAINVIDKTDDPNGVEVERHVVSADPDKLDGFRRSRYLEDVINNNSRYIRVKAASDLDTDALPFVEVGGDGTTFADGELISTGDGTITTITGTLATKPLQRQSLAVETEEESVTGEAAGSGDGTETTFTGTVDNFPVSADSFSVTSGSVTATDDEDGVLTGTGITSGSIDYETGVFEVTFSAAPASGTDNVTVDYDYTLILEDDGVGGIAGAGGSGTISYTSGAYSITFDAAPTSGQEIRARYHAVQIVDLTKGDNGDTPTAAQKNTAWEMFRNTDDVSVQLLIGGGEESITVQTRMVDICEDRKDCMAILDTPASKERAGDAVAWRRVTQNINSTYAALYPGRYKAQVEGSTKVENLPRSGFEAAVYANTDAVAAPWVPPAGLRRGIVPVNGVTVAYTLGERNVLYDNQLNPYRVLQGQGIVTWGQKTQQSGQETALSRVNVRRLLLVGQRDTSRSLEQFIHQLNTEFTRLQVTQILSEYWQRVENDGGITEFDGEPAFLVVCDESNNSSSVIDANELRVDQYIRPTKSAEFINLQTVVVRTGTVFDELVGTGSFV